ncbi:MAG: DinB family protein [Chitinophagaceae bacterium]
MRPSPEDYSGFYKTYVDYTTGDNLQQMFGDSLPQLESFLFSIPVAKASFAYAEGKWTLKELVQHCIDTERIFNYRALCIARGEQQNLPGFDENHYAASSNANARNWEGLVEELPLVRKATIMLFNSFNEEQLQQKGSSNNNPVTCNALGFIIIGHLMHHERIIKERYI